MRDFGQLTFVVCLAAVAALAAQAAPPAPPPGASQTPPAGAAPRAGGAPPAGPAAQAGPPPPSPQALENGAKVMADVRKALGGDQKQAAVKTIVATGRTRRVSGENLVPVEFEIDM